MSATHESKLGRPRSIDNSDKAVSALNVATSSIAQYSAAMENTDAKRAALAKMDKETALLFESVLKMDVSEDDFRVKVWTAYRGILLHIFNNLAKYSQEQAATADISKAREILRYAQDLYNAHSKLFPVQK